MKLRGSASASPDPSAPELPPIHVATETWDDNLEVADIEVADPEVPDLEANDSDDEDPGDGTVGGLADGAARPPSQPSPFQPSPIQSSEDAAAPSPSDCDSKAPSESAHSSNLAETPSVSAEAALFQDALVQRAPLCRRNSETQPKPIPSPSTKNISTVMNGLRSKTECSSRSTRTQSGGARFRNGAATRTAGSRFHRQYNDDAVKHRIGRKRSPLSHSPPCYRSPGTRPAQLLGIWPGMLQRRFRP